MNFLRKINHYVVSLRYLWSGISFKAGRIGYLVVGYTMGRGCRVGKIRCNSPMRVEFGDNCRVEDGLQIKINHPFERSVALRVGSNCFLGADCYCNISSKVSIGSDSLVSARCLFIDVGHEVIASQLTRKQASPTAPIVIGENVWIGAGATILAGVEIGEGSVIGAGAVVNKSVPSREIWAGVPAKKIRDVARGDALHEGRDVFQVISESNVGEGSRI